MPGLDICMVLTTEFPVFRLYTDTEVNTETYIYPTGETAIQEQPVRGISVPVVPFAVDMGVMFAPSVMYSVVSL
jgi:hypothetical protein